MSKPEITPSFEEFSALTARGNLIPVRCEVLADLETPVSAFLKLGRACPQNDAFLLESVEGGENLARYSFLGLSSRGFLKTQGRQAWLSFDGQTREIELNDGLDPLHVLQRALGAFQYVDMPGLPRFPGGAVGFLGWDLVRFFEKLPDAPPDDRNLPDCHLILTDTVLIFDAVRHTITVLNNAYVPAGGDVRAAYDEAVAKIHATLMTLRDERVQAAMLSVVEPREPEPKSNFAQRADFEAAVARCVEYIKAGDCVQVVPSQRFAVPLHGTEPFQVYRALRHLSPAPYMVYLRLGDVHLIAASPEILVTEDKGHVLTRPLAGTRRRGATPEEDAALEAELLNDPKELAEHVMLVDLGRNDLGRVCKYGSVKVSELMYVQRFSHVMHITSDVVGELQEGKNAFDVLRATFPAGTLSGAPKVRAMQIIDELEPTRRGPYGGAMGYFSFNGNMDTCITLRTIVVKNDVAYVQAGGGVVADSVPELEYEETRNKARAALRAIQLAQGAAID